VIQVRAGVRPRQRLLAPEQEWVRVALVAPLLMFPGVWPTLTVAGLALFALASVAARPRGEAAPRQTPLTLPAVALAVCVLTGAAITPAPDLAVPKAAGVLLGLLAARAVLLSAATPRRLAAAVAGYLTLGLFWLVAGVFATAWLGKFPLLDRITSLLPRLLPPLPGAAPEGVHPNALAGTTLLFLPLIGFLLRRRAGEAGERMSAASRKTSADAADSAEDDDAEFDQLLDTWRVGLIVVFALLVALLVLTQSRTAWGALAVSVVIVVMAAGPRTRRWLVVGGCVACAGVLAFRQWLVGAVAPWMSGFGTNIHPTEVTAAVRVELWTEAVAAIRDFPLTGLGLNAFRRVGPVFYPPLQMSPDFDFAHAHNVFLQVALDAGLPGLLAYVWLIGTALVLCARVARQGGARRALALGLAGSVVAVHLFGLADAIALGAKVGLFLWIVLGLCAALYAQSVRPPGATSSGTSEVTRRRAGGLVSIVLILAIAGVVVSAREACGNALALDHLRGFFRPGAAAVPGGVRCADREAVRAGRGAWHAGVDLVLRRELRAAERPLAAGLAGMSAADRRRHIDQLLVLSASDRPAPDRALVAFALAFARAQRHDTAMGYLAVGKVCRAHQERGIDACGSATEDALALAGGAGGGAFRDVVARAEASFMLGRLYEGAEDPRALDAFRAAMATDPGDVSGGYAWMSAARAVELLARDRRWDEARALLDYAATLPDLYHRRSYTALRRAELEAALGDDALAMSLLERATDRDPDLAATHAMLAALYRKHGRTGDAVARYRRVLALDPRHPEAVKALSELAPS
jgi:putative inorganic carbon (HCO3(-)) transporter